ncbi:hypothetical protein QE370_003191 [Aeromicrobium sp. SORGH_AS981]|nr:hypothetical protein [Aeromicrobium sp. SORGH_AS_0981]
MGRGWGGVWCRCAACGSSDLAAALPQGVWVRWCAAAGGLHLLVRCLGWRWGGLRKGLDRAAGDGAGLGSRAVAWARSGPKILRPRRDPLVNAEALELGYANAETYTPAARYRWICSRRTVPAVADPPIGRANAERWIKNAETKNRASPRGRSQTPRPQAAHRPVAGRGPFRRPPPAKAEAAHQQPQVSCGDAPATREPRRHRTSGTRAPQAPHQHDQRPAATPPAAQDPHLHQGRRARDGGGGRLVTR